MSLKGNLATMGLPELLQLLAHGRKTGTLVVDNGEVEKKILFDQGRIVSSASSDPEESLDGFLLKRGLVDRETVEKARKMQETNPMLLGKILVTVGALTEEQLLEVLGDKARDSISEMFRWQSAEFEFFEAEVSEKSMVTMSMGVTGVVLEGLHRLDEEAAQGAVPPAEAVEPVDTESPERIEQEPVGIGPFAGEPFAAEPAAEEPFAEEPAAEEPDAVPFEEEDEYESEDEISGVAAPAVAAEEDSRTEYVEQPHDLEETSDDPSDAGEYRGVYQVQEEEGDRQRLVWIIGATVAVAVIAVIAFFVFRGGGAAPGATAEEPSPESIEQGAVESGEIAPGEEGPIEGVEGVEPGDPAAEEEVGLSEEDLLEARIQELAAEQAADLKESMRAEYAARIAALERQLQEASSDADDEETTAPAGGGDVAERTSPSSDSSGSIAAEPAATEPTGGTSSGSLGSDAAVEAGTPTSKPASEAEDVEAAAARQQSGSPQRESSGSGSVSSGKVATTSEARSGSQQKQPPVQRGDLVAPGPGVSPPQLLRRPSPSYPPGARRLGREGKVIIQVLVDEGGRVIDLRQTGEAAGYGFDKAASDAARKTRWEPASKQGVKVKMWVDLIYAFNL